MPTPNEQWQDLIDELHRRVDEAWQREDYPNAPCAATYVKHAEAMDLKVQKVCDSGGSTGAYYTVYAVYDTNYIFCVEPVCLIFEDFSKSVDITWVKG